MLPMYTKEQKAHYAHRQSPNTCAQIARVQMRDVYYNEDITVNKL